jgi:hypothetical protein
VGRNCKQGAGKNQDFIQTGVLKRFFQVAVYLRSWNYTYKVKFSIMYEYELQRTYALPVFSIICIYSILYYMSVISQRRP